MKQRNIAVCIILSLVTCGIYGLYWFVVMTNESNQVSGRPNSTSGGVSLLLMIITCNIYGLYWAYKMGEKIDAAKQMRRLAQRQQRCAVPHPGAGVPHCRLGAHAE